MGIWQKKLGNFEAYPHPSLPKLNLRRDDTPCVLRHLTDYCIFVPKCLKIGNAVVQLDALEHVARQMSPLEIKLEQRDPSRSGKRRPRLQSEVLDVQVLQSRALSGQCDDVRARQKGLSAGPMVMYKTRILGQC